MQNQKWPALSHAEGFTIIELIVVVAIIVVLAGAILINITGYIKRGKEVAIRGNMETMINNAEMYFDQNPYNKGADFILSSGYTSPAAAVAVANGGSTITKYGSNTDMQQTWCACSRLLNSTTENGTFCVDSTGYKKATANDSRCAIRCPSTASPACVD